MCFELDESVTIHSSGAHGADDGRQRRHVGRPRGDVQRFRSGWCKQSSMLLNVGGDSVLHISMRNAKRHREIQNDIAGPGQKFEFRASPDANPRPGATAAADGSPSTQNTSKLPPLVHCRCPRPSWTNARPRGCACWAPLGSGGISGPGPWSGNRDVLKFPMDPGSWIPPSAAPCSTGSTDRQVVFAGWSCFLGPTRTWRTTSWQTTTAAVGKGVVVLAPWW